MSHAFLVHILSNLDEDVILFPNRFECIACEPVVRKRVVRSLVALMMTVAAWNSTTSRTGAQVLPRRPDTIRIATFNASLNRNTAGQLVSDLSDDQQQQPRQVAAILQHVAPDILLLNEFDYDEKGQAASLFVDNFLNQPQYGQTAIQYTHRFHQAVNTGVPTGIDLDGNERRDDPQDAYGFGRFPGQYGMLVLSKYPIQRDASRTFQRFLWKDLKDAPLPRKEDGKPYYSSDAIERLRLSSKSHWDVPVRVPGLTLHILASHPTPPVFDGPEDRNGLRNQAEIRFWHDYISTDTQRQDALYDDAGKRGGLPTDASFVIMGDLNSDPHDGDSRHDAITKLLSDPRINSQFTPSSRGAVSAAKQQGQVNREHQGESQHDTADFFDGGSGNLRVDYVLPSGDLDVVASGVFWPEPGELGSEWIACSDHRLVWIDIRITAHAE